MGDSWLIDWNKENKKERKKKVGDLFTYWLES